MKILLITPPMTQLNTPYPATAYLTGFLKQQGYDVSQRNLASLFIDDISAMINQGVDPNFEISRYGERLAASSTCFNFISG